MESLDDWSDCQDIDNSKIDEIGGYLMLALSQGGINTAGDIVGYLDQMAEQTGRDSIVVDQTQQIHYRIDNHLEPMGLVLFIGLDHEPDGGGHPRRIYTLTEKGAGWVESQTWGPKTVTEALVQMDDYVISMESEVRDELSEMADRLTTVEKSIESVTGTLGGLQSSISDVDDRYEGLEQDQSNLAAIQTRQSGQIDEMDTRLDEIEDQLDEVETTIEQLSSNDHSLDSSLSSLSDRVASLSEQITSIESDAEAALEASAQPTLETEQNSQQITRLRYAVVGEGIVLVLLMMRGMTV